MLSYFVPIPTQPHNFVPVTAWKPGVDDKCSGEEINPYISRASKTKDWYDTTNW